MKELQPELKVRLETLFGVAKGCEWRCSLSFYHKLKRNREACEAGGRIVNAQVDLLSPR